MTIQLRHVLVSTAVAMAVLWPAGPAIGSCGQATCTVDPRLTAQQTVSQPGQIHLDLSMEYIEQDEPHVGYHSVPVGAVPRPDHQEVSTTNLTWKLNTEFALTDRWAAGVLVPLLHREHLHLAVDEGAATSASGARARASNAAHSGSETNASTVTIGEATGTPEQWNFTDLGDMQLTARYAALRPSEPTGLGLSLIAGLKLPTGRTDVRNSDGEEAEITLQPGTGSVDPIVAGVLQRSFAVTKLSGESTLSPAFAGIVIRPPGSEGRYDYRPGLEVLLNSGVSYPLTSKLQALGQINFRYRDRDHVGHAPGVPREHTGGEYLYLSPGLQIDLAERLAGYTYVQVPVLQRVNGLQLVSNWNLLVGLSYDVGP